MIRRRFWWAWFLGTVVAACSWNPYPYVVPLPPAPRPPTPTPNPKPPVPVPVTDGTISEWSVVEPFATRADAEAAGTATGPRLTRVELNAALKKPFKVVNITAEPKRTIVSWHAKKGTGNLNVHVTFTSDKDDATVTSFNVR